MTSEVNAKSCRSNQQCYPQHSADSTIKQHPCIDHRILVLSGKGGVGKSSVAVNLAVWLSMQGKTVGLLDIDIHGPSVPRLLNLEGHCPQGSHGAMEPIDYTETLKVMSVGFLLNNANDAVIWRGPMKHNVIGQFISQVAWGHLDYLVVDCPPGTGDEPLSIVQLLGHVDGAVVVTTPQQLAINDVKKCLTFCRQLSVPVLGVVENMSGFVCPHCGEHIDIFGHDGGRAMAAEFGVPFLGSIPIDPAMVQAAEAGTPFIYFNGNSPTAGAIDAAFTPLLSSDPQEPSLSKESDTMKISIPLVQGQLSLHFGHCDQFAIFDIADDGQTITNRTDHTPPAHEPGVLPRWLGEMKVDVIIAGGMGTRAQQLFTQNNIKVVVGASSEAPEALVSAYLTGELTTGDNICDH